MAATRGAAVDQPWGRTEGAQVVSSWGAAALGRWAGMVQHRAARARPDGQDPSARDPAAGEAPHPLGTRLLGTPVPLTRLATVRPGTVAVVLQTGRLPVLQAAGALLLPPLLTRAPAAVQVQVASTEPVHVDVVVDDLTSLDGYAVAPVRLRLELQLAAGHTGLGQRVAEHGAGLEALLLAEVRQRCRDAVQGAVRVNRHADLQRLTLRRVLGDRWLPGAFAGGLLLCRDVEVLPADRGAEDEHTVVLPAPAPTAPLDPDAATDDIAPMAAQP